MLNKGNNIIEHFLYRKIDKTNYEISVKQSENASETAEDIILRLIVAGLDDEGDGSYG